MLPRRSAILVVVVGILAWVSTILFTAGFDGAATQYRAGTQFVDLGLPAFGSLFIGRASNAYRRRISSPSSPDQPSPDVSSEDRRKLGECELALAKLFRERGNFERAKYHYGRAETGCPELATEARCWAAYVDGLDDQPGARKTLLGVLVDEPDNPLPSYLVGRLFLREDKLAEGRRYLQRSLEATAGETYPTLLALARVCEQAGEREQAVEHARRALERAETATQKRGAAVLLQNLGAPAPSPLGIWIRTFAVHHRSGLIGVAVVIAVLFYPTWLGLAVRFVPSLAALLYLLGRSSEPSAIKAYEAALRRWPNSSRLLRVLAGAYGRLGVGATRAAELWERLCELRPGDQDALSETVRLALECGRENEIAVRACQTWFDDHADHPNVGIVAAHLARAYRARGMTAPESALPALHVASQAAPSDRDLHLYLGALYSHYGRNPEAAAVLAELLESDPTDEASRLEYAHALIGAGEAYDAYRHLRLLPPSADLTTDLYLAGVVAHGAGRYRESLRILQEVVRRHPGLFDVEERVAEASVRAVQNRYGQFEVTETVAAHEACLLHHASHPEHGEVLLLVFRRDFSDALGFPEAFAERFGELREPTEGCAEILDFGSDEGECYVAYRMPDGRPLSLALEESGTMANEQAATVTIAVLEALAGLQSAGQIHGDLRPSAVWISDGHGARLVGAGASQVAETEPATSPPGARSPYHVAPEIVEEHALSGASDIYAVGCMLYQLLVGAPPFEGPTHLATMMAHVTIEPEPPSMRAPGVPPEMDDIVLRALAKNPEDRPPSASDFARELRELFAEPEEPKPAEPSVEDDQYVLPLTPEEAVAAGPAEPPDPTRWWTLYEGLVILATARFAKVYRGIHRQSGEPHAIKHLHVPRTASAAESMRPTRAAQAVWRLFQSEMHILQSLAEAQTPIAGITTMLQAYRADENSPAYAMPLMEKTLAARIERDGPLPEDQAVEVIRSLAATVADLHEREFVHRGISPRSVMFARDGNVYLGGFDAACRLSERNPLLLAEQEVQQITRSPLYILGDIRFLSPERCRGEEFDRRTDIYSLGALLFYMLVGSAPFERADEMQIMLDHVSTPPPRLRDRGIAASENLQEVIDHALAKSPSDRYENVAAMLGALASGGSAFRWQE